MPEISDYRSLAKLHVNTESEFVHDYDGTFRTNMICHCYLNDQLYIHIYSTVPQQLCMNSDGCSVYI